MVSDDDNSMSSGTLLTSNRPDLALQPGHIESMLHFVAVRGPDLDSLAVFHPRYHDLMCVRRNPGLKRTAENCDA